MKGGEFFFAPSISFLKQLKKADWKIAWYQIRVNNPFFL
jgi:hypothetical protein